MGRPSSATAELMEAICDAIAEGQSLRQICEADNMPHRRTVEHWLAADVDFAAKYARARETQADVMDEKILSVADKCTPEDAAASRVKIDAYKWRASKLAPKRYGDKLAIAGDAESPLLVHKTTTIDVTTASTAFLQELAALAPPNPS